MKKTNKETKFIGNAKMFDEKIKNIKGQFFSALDDYKKNYVYYNKNPEVNEFQNHYETSKSQLQSISKDLFLTSNDIDKNIEALNDDTSDISEKIKKEKVKYEQLKSQYDSLKNTENGSILLIDDSKDAYTAQYYLNWEIFIGIFIAMESIYLIFIRNGV